jgi:hypothetical protein
MGIENARIARDLTYAQLLCESKLAEIASGITLPDPVHGVPFGTTSDASELDWLYSIEVAPLDDQGLTAVQVTVFKELPPQERPVQFSLVRWMVDSGAAMTDISVSQEPVSE